MSPCPAFSPAQRLRGLTFACATLTLACAGCLPSTKQEGLEIAQFDYGSASRHAACKTTKQGAAGATDGLISRESISYNVRTPANYDPTIAHPLLIVYAAASMTAARSESLTHLTSAATGRGFVVAYAGHRAMSVETVGRLAKLPNEIAESWCIDRGRVFATGHSDGGTVSTAIALLEETKGTLAGIAPSAAGFRRQDLETLKCPSRPLPVMVMHSNWDIVFPGWGAEAAKWWAACNHCDAAKPAEPLDEQCSEYKGCPANGATWYCEGNGWHSEWPELGERIISFFEVGGRDSRTEARNRLGVDISSAICRASAQGAVEMLRPQTIAGAPAMLLGATGGERH